MGFIVAKCVQALAGILFITLFSLGIFKFAKLIIRGLREDKKPTKP